MEVYRPEKITNPKLYQKNKGMGSNIQNYLLTITKLLVLLLNI